jgi:MFS family permease
MNIEDMSESNQADTMGAGCPASSSSSQLGDREVGDYRATIVVLQATRKERELTAFAFSICFGLFLSLIDTSIVATALYTIGMEFNSLDSVTWVALAYTLSYLGCAVTFARMGDIIGRRNAFALAFLVFISFSLCCGFSKSLNQLIACRALQGIGGSGLNSLSMVIIPEITPPKVVKWISGLAGVVITISGVLGPVLGGIITQYTTWRWIFWIK